jgi:hypothetical protein
MFDDSKWARQLQHRGLDILLEPLLAFSVASDNHGGATRTVTSVTDPSDPITDGGLKASVGETVSITPVDSQGLGPGSDDQVVLEIGGVEVKTFCGPSERGACGA